MRHVRGERWRKAARPGVWVEIAVQQSRSAPAGSDFDARGGGMVLCQPNANVSGVVAGPPTCLAALRMRRFPSGSHPNKGISEARSEARTLHTRVKQHGADPVAERRRERAMAAAAKQGVGTLGAL